MLTDFLGTTVPRLAAPFFRDVVWRGPSHSADGSPCLYLSFDDGPHPESTPLILDYLSKTETHAAFFFLGSQADQFPDLVHEAAEAGHKIGNHGWSHRSAWRTPKEETLRDFERAEQLLEHLAGQPVRDVRPPYGRFTSSLRQWCKEDGRRLVLWDVMPGDFMVGAHEQLVGRIGDRVAGRTKPGSIVVLHENARACQVVLPALDHALPILRASGWTVASL